ncbi:MAG: transporter [Halioglobus sp.]
MRDDRFIGLALGLCLLLCSSLVWPQALEPRSYSNVPIDETFMVAGYIQSEGELTPTPTSPLQDAELTIDIGVLGFAQTFSLAGSSAKFDMAVSRQCFEGSGVFRGEFVEGRRCGYGDPNLRLTWNFYGAPALKLQDYAAWKPGLVIGTSVQVSVPVGSYEEDVLINVGTNRWMVRPGMGMSFSTGRWHIDAIASVRFFEDNDDFFEGIYVEQDPIYGLQSHLIYNFSGGRWLSLNANFFWGGESTFDGSEADNRQENSRLGLTFSMPMNRHHSFKLYANKGVITSIGNDFDTLGAAWQYRF